MSTQRLKKWECTICFNNYRLIKTSHHFRKSRAKIMILDKEYLVQIENTINANKK